MASWTLKGIKALDELFALDRRARFNLICWLSLLEPCSPIRRFAPFSPLRVTRFCHKSIISDAFSFFNIHARIFPVVKLKSNKLDDERIQIRDLFLHVSGRIWQTPDAHHMQARVTMYGQTQTQAKNRYVIEFALLVSLHMHTSSHAQSIFDCCTC